MKNSIANPKDYHRLIEERYWYPNNGKVNIICGPQMSAVLDDMFGDLAKYVMSGSGIQFQIENHKKYDAVWNGTLMVNSDNPQKPKIVGKLPMSNIYYDALGCHYRVYFSGGKTWYAYMYSTIKETTIF